MLKLVDLLVKKVTIRTFGPRLANYKETIDMINKGSLLGHGASFVAYAIFGLNIVICKDITHSDLLSPLALFCFRSIGAGLLFWALSLFTPSEHVEKRDLPKILAASVLGFFLTQITFLIAIADITPMDCSIISALSPIYTMCIAAIVLKEPITLKKAGGVLISLCGIIYLITTSVSATGAVTQTKPMGVFLIFMNSLCFSLYLGIFKPLISKYSVVTFMKWIFLFATLMSLPFAAPEMLRIDYAALSGKYLAEVSFLIVCATFIAYFLIPISQKLIRPTLVSMYSYVQPIIAIVISISVGMDTLTWQKVLAALTVFSGVLLVSFSHGAK